jgi:hypothetical protein
MLDFMICDDEQFGQEGFRNAIAFRSLGRFPELRWLLTAGEGRIDMSLAATRI